MVHSTNAREQWQFSHLEMLPYPGYSEDIVLNCVMKVFDKGESLSRKFESVRKIREVAAMRA